jgi:hypothetical protein
VEEGFLIGASTDKNGEMEYESEREEGREAEDT